MPSSFHKCVVFVTIHGLLNYFCSVSQLCSTHCDSFWVASNFLFLQTLLAGTFLTTDVCLWVFSYVQLFVALWTVAHRDPLFMDFSRQEYWSGLAFPTPGDLPNPGIEPACLASSASAGGFFTTSATWEAWELGLAFSYRNIVIQMGGLKPQERA